MQIDLNCDVGESYYEKLIGNDKELIPLISSCNIACGFHGGDPVTIQTAIETALQSGVHIGAHPSFPDLENFGRKYMRLSSEELKACLQYQIGALMTMTEAQGGVLRHVKLHGALYNAAALDFELSVEIIEVLKGVDGDLFFLGMANSEMEKAAEYLKYPFISEAFADRAYTDTGDLVVRSNSNAVIKDLEKAANQSLSMVLNNVLVTETKKEIYINPTSICVHGDNKNALELVKALRKKFEDNNVKVKAF
jgi:UPF0271 protein